MIKYKQHASTISASRTGSLPCRSLPISNPQESSVNALSSGPALPSRRCHCDKEEGSLQPQGEDRSRAAITAATPRVYCLPLVEIVHDCHEEEAYHETKQVKSLARPRSQVEIEVTRFLYIDRLTTSERFVQYCCTSPGENTLKSLSLKSD
jgi:hypothetical protein